MDYQKELSTSKRCCILEVLVAKYKGGGTKDGLKDIQMRLFNKTGFPAVGSKQKRLAGLRGVG